MAEFIYGNEINIHLEEMIKHADNFLWLISPYIKLHDRLRAELSAKVKCYDLKIVVLFGKNEQDASKSITKDDIQFFMQFPNIKICYEKNLHAKYYASEDFALLTSMNLHQFSQNTNIEAGILIHPKKSLEQIANVLVSTQNIEEAAAKYFSEIIERSMLLFHSEPQYKKEFLGISKKYIRTDIKINDIDKFFSKQRNFPTNNTNSQFNSASEAENKYQKPIKKRYGQPTAYCIRTGAPIYFDISMPYCEEAFESWSKYRNYDFPENFCHSTGQPSYKQTSMRNPILKLEM